MKALGVKSFARDMFKCFTYVREIKSACKYAMQRVVVFRNGIHVSVYRGAKPAFYVITRSVSHLKHIKQCNNIRNLIKRWLQQTNTSSGQFLLMTGE